MTGHTEHKNETFVNRCLIGSFFIRLLVPGLMSSFNVMKDKDIIGLPKKS